METVLKKLPKLTQRQKKYLDLISIYSFYLGLLIELTIVILDKSEYIIQYEGWWFRITFLLFGLSMVTGKHGLKSWICFVVMALMGVTSYFHTGRNEILRAVVMIWACEGKNMKKALKFTFWYTAAGCGVLFLLSVLGIYGDVFLEAVYRTDAPWTPGEVERRYCFGMGHPNAFHCMMLAITWLGIYCYHEKIKWYGYVLISIGHVVVYLFTDSRTGLLMSVGSMILIVTLHYSKFLQEWKWSYLLGILVVIATVAFSIFMAKYSVHHPFLKELDKVLSGRITNLYYDNTNHAGMLNTWFLWSVRENRVFFDLGTIRMFYWFGIIPAAVYFLAQCRLIWCGFLKKDYMLLAMIVSIAIYTVFEAHFISDYMGRNYILLWIGMYLSQMVGVKEIETAENKE